MAEIAELFGIDVRKSSGKNMYMDTLPEEWLERKCPFSDGNCDVTANRSNQAHLDIGHAALKDNSDLESIREIYGPDQIQFGICSIDTKRQNEKRNFPWIVCPRRMASIGSEKVYLPEALRKNIGFKDGQKIRCWKEVKFRHKLESQNSEEDPEFFEYTFDYLLIPIEGDEKDFRFTGKPVILEIMSASTRGGGLTEHLIDLLLQREQRELKKEVVKSRYTPNYRQVFERMLGQFFAKSEVAEKWNGKAIWIVQDVLMKYIEETTAFRSSSFKNAQDGNCFIEVVGLSNDNLREMKLVHSLRGKSKSVADNSGDFTSMLSLGHYPELVDLENFLRGTQPDGDKKKTRKKNYVDIQW